jgi:hypothetical protein
MARNNRRAKDQVPESAQLVISKTDEKNDFRCGIKSQNSRGRKVFKSWLELEEELRNKAL